MDNQTVLYDRRRQRTRFFGVFVVLVAAFWALIVLNINIGRTYCLFCITISLLPGSVPDRLKFRGLPHLPPEESVDRSAMKIASRFSRFPHILGETPANAVHIAILIWHHIILVAWLSW